MTDTINPRVPELVRSAAHPLTSVQTDYDPLLELIGFTTYTGTVTAANDWDGPAERKRVRPGMPGSYERLFHEVGIPNFLLPLRGGRDELRAESRPRHTHRACEMDKTQALAPAAATAPGLRGPRYLRR